jgi:hypothetical protein
MALARERECQEAPFDIIEARDIHQPNGLAAKASV